MESKTKKIITLSGVVTSDKMNETAVVTVERFIKLPKYGKYIQRRKRYKAHNLGNVAKVGDKVTIMSVRPLSKHKTFEIAEVEKKDNNPEVTEN